MIPACGSLTDGRGAERNPGTAGNSPIKRHGLHPAGGKVMLFAQEQRSEAPIDRPAVCMGEKGGCLGRTRVRRFQDENVRLGISGEL